MELDREYKVIYESTLDFSRKYLSEFIDIMESEDRFPNEIWELLAKQGYLGAGIPEKYGGSGGDYVEAALICQAISRVSPAIALSYGAHLNLCAHNIARNGTEEQKKIYLPALCSGQMIGAVALTEPNHGSDAMGIQLSAKKTFDEYVLHGTKMFITNGSIASLILVYARTTPGKNAKGLTAFLVETDQSGYMVSNKLNKLGMRGSPTNELMFENVFVATEQIVGEVDKGYLIAMNGLDLERAFLTSIPVGIMEECLERSLQYSKEREQFGRTISNFQLIKAKLADMYVNLAITRNFYYRVLLDIQNGNRMSKDAACAILFAGEKAMQAAHQAVQIFGGYGYTKDFPLERFFRDSKLLEIGAGTSEIRRLLIADELLGLR